MDLPQNLVSFLTKYGRKLAPDESGSRKDDADVAVGAAFAGKTVKRDVKAVGSQELPLLPAHQISRAYIKLVKKPVSDKCGISKQPKRCSLIPPPS